MSKEEALKLALEALERAERDGGWSIATTRAITAPPAQPAPVQPVAWVPYLSDRADGLQGHYAIARWNPRGYREVWNLRRHAWGAFSDDVMSLEEADYLLQQITIPTRKPTPPAQPAPVQEPVAWMTQARNFVHVMEFTEAEAKLYGWIPVYTTPPAQPVIPDAMTSADIQEHIEYVAGWNDCRQAMLEMMK